MKFLRDYDEALDTSVVSILEQNFADGVRSINQTVATDHDPITTIPSNSSIFPVLSQADIKETSLCQNRTKVLFFTSRRDNDIVDISPSDWSSAGLADSVDKYVTGICRYRKRMESVISRGSSWASTGASSAADMSEAVFSRISSLRDIKSTKQVKQRALVDLFKCLKEQGYSSMKWSVPAQVKDPQQLLQLPIPSVEKFPKWDTGVSSILEQGESYFHRCQVEIARLRFEISMLGSQYMSQREMTLMQG